MGLADILESGVDVVRKGESSASRLLSEGSRIGRELVEGWDKQTKGFSKSFEYQEGGVISGEARAVHPNMFAQFTPLRIIGVSKLPVAGAKGAQFIVKNRNVIKGGVGKSLAWTKKGKNTLEKGLKNSSENLKRIRNPLPKTTGTLKKSPIVRKSAVAGAGAVVSAIVNSGKDNSTSGQRKPLDSDIFIKRKRVDRSRWV